MSVYMSEEEIKFALIIKQMDIPFKIDVKNDRIILQKIGYFCSLLGLNLNDRIHFSWYKNGPYSPDLTKVYYALNKNISMGIFEFLNRDLSVNEDEIVETVKNLYDSKPEDIEDPSDWMELTASVCYLHGLLGKESAIDFIERHENKRHLHVKNNYDRAIEALSKCKINCNSSQSFNN